MLMHGSLRGNNVNDIIYDAESARESNMGSHEGRYGFMCKGRYGYGITNSISPGNKHFVTIFSKTCNNRLIK